MAYLILFYKDRLDSAGITVPDNVTNVYYDNHHNSIWAVSITGTNKPVSPTRVEFTILHKIVGGTGRFEEATGAYTINGYFNPQTQQTFFSINGRIDD